MVSYKMTGNDSSNKYESCIVWQCITILFTEEDQLKG